MSLCFLLTCGNLYLKWNLQQSHMDIPGVILKVLKRLKVLVDLFFVSFIWYNEGLLSDFSSRLIYLSQIILARPGQLVKSHLISVSKMYLKFSRKFLGLEI